jgi:hypothetical protein
VCQAYCLLDAVLLFGLFLHLEVLPWQFVSPLFSLSVLVVDSWFSGEMAHCCCVLVQVMGWSKFKWSHLQQLLRS